MGNVRLRFLLNLYLKVYFQSATFYKRFTKYITGKSVYTNEFSVCSFEILCPKLKHMNELYHIAAQVIAQNKSLHEVT